MILNGIFFFIKMKRGIEIIIGPMFCGKTSELLRRIRREKIAGSRVQLFKPLIDKRYSKEEVVSHDYLKEFAFKVGSTNGIKKFLDPDVEIIGIDEIQFFDDYIIDFCLDYSKSKLIIAAAPALDFRDEPFKFRDSKRHIGDLLPYCKITSLTSICTYKKAEEICGKEAIHTQRILNEKPAEYDSPLIMIGGKETYEARCDEHYIKPIKK
jgi:thymidine kinase